MGIEKYLESSRMADMFPTDIKKPNLLRQAQIKLMGMDDVISELNKICKIEYSGNMVGFTPRIDYGKFGDRGHSNVYLESRGYVTGLLQKLGFSVKIDNADDKGNWPNSSSYVVLDNPKNLKLMQRFGSRLGFYYKRPLQQQDINNLKKKQYS